MHMVSPNEAGSDAWRLSAEGWRVFTLPNGIANRNEFVASLAAMDFPFDPKMESVRNWDALLDSLEGGLLSFAGERVALIWPDPASMRHRLPAEYAALLSVLEGVWVDSTYWEDGPTEFRVIVGDRDENTAHI